MMRDQAHKAVDQLFSLGEMLIGRRVPPEASEHFRNARREALLGMRLVVDHALAKLDEEAARAEEQARGPRSIPVEEE